MSGSNHYKWLIVVEGNTDAKTYENLLVRYGAKKNDFCLVSAHGKSYVCNATTWDHINVPNAANSKLYTLVDHDIGRVDFCGIILLVDSDANSFNAFKEYNRNPNLSYVETSAPTPENKGHFWHLDDLNGRNQIPIYGINVPMNSTGCLETDLLDSYGFPIEGQPEYENIVDAIQKASNHWQIQKHGDGKNWWEENKRAKLDKFIYSAFSHGFEVSNEYPSLPTEPSVIQNIKQVIGAKP
ncbi:MAG: hypothetical protein FWH48_01350 [Oscillospiraceae bacterium]|nr:hypothetical protein [Oscillospiraceae bacterium]